MKKRLICLCALALVLVCVFVLPATAEAATEGNYTYSVTDGKATVTGYTGEDSEVIIPSTLGGYPVTAIGNSAFSECYEPISVVIPEGVVTIGNSAFDSCYRLASVTIPEGVTTIGRNAFQFCEKLTAVELPDSVRSIGAWAFSCCSITSVTIPDGVTVIDESTFQSCTKLTEVIIPASVKTIGEYAFTECFGLTSLTVPSGVKTIGDYAFYQCGVTDVTIAGNVTKMGIGVFEGCDNLEKATIGNGLTVIGENMFRDCDKLTVVSFGKNLKTIGACAFAGCDGLTSVAFTDSVTTIRGSAFRDCTKLTKVTLGAGVTAIGEFAFEGCEKLTSFSVSQNNTKFTTDSKSVLYDKKKTRIVAVPKGISGSYTIAGTVTTIGDAAFLNCNKLTAVTIPSGVTAIGEQAFAGCSGLLSVSIPGKVTTIGNEAFGFCGGLTVVTIPNSVKTIGDRAFYNCSKLAAVSIGSKVTTIGSSAFRGCALTEVTIPNSVTSIGAYAFFECKKLVYVTIGTGVKHVYGNAFRYYYGANTKYKVYYAGSSSQWYDIDIADGSEQLTMAKIKFKHTHKFKSGKCTGCDIQPVVAKITAQPKSVATNSGATAKFTVKASGMGLKYQWYYAKKGASSFKKISGATGATYSVKVSSSVSGRKYYCLVTDQYNKSVKSSTVTLTLKTVAKITTQPKGLTVISGKTAKLTVKAVGDGAKYAWYYMKPGATGYTKSSVTATTFSVKMSGAWDNAKVYCVVADKYGNTVKSSVVTIKMPAQPKVTTQPKSVTQVSGKTVKFSVKASGEGLKYQWYYTKKGSSSFKKLSGKTSATYSVKVSSSVSGRKYYCLVTDKYGQTVKSSAVTLTLKTVAKITTQPKSVTVKNGSTAKVTIKAAGDGLTYTWYYLKPGATKYAKSSIATNVFSVKMAAAWKNAKVYCVIADKYGNTVKSSVVTLKMK